MARSVKFKRGLGLDTLTDRQEMFVLEYTKDFDATNAAIRAGYNPGTASVQGAKLLSNSLVAKAVSSRMAKLRKKIELTTDVIIKQLFYAVTRTLDDFDDGTGKICMDLKKLSKRAKACVEGIKQTVKTYTDADGNTTEDVITELKLMSKTASIDLAMKHLGMFAATKVEGEVKHVLDLTNLVNFSQGNGEVADPLSPLTKALPAPTVDPVEQAILEVEAKVIPKELPKANAKGSSIASKASNKGKTVNNPIPKKKPLYDVNELIEE